MKFRIHPRREACLHLRRSFTDGEREITTLSFSTHENYFFWARPRAGTCSPNLAKHMYRPRCVLGCYIHSPTSGFLAPSFAWKPHMLCCRGTAWAMLYSCIFRTSNLDYGSSSPTATESPFRWLSHSAAPAHLPWKVSRRYLRSRASWTCFSEMLNKLPRAWDQSPSSVMDRSSNRMGMESRRSK